tara:strand:+ start:1433 stop:2239 length:807 start_codon:yes stop_codon:yes gene_type:complete
MSICSPHISGKICYSKNDLLYITRLYNKYTNNKIKLSNLKKLELWNLLHDRFEHLCDNQLCWIEQKYIPKHFYIKTKDKFKPKMPHSWFKNINEWLSTLEIEAVMNQYDQKYKKFKFLGAVPSDCPKSITCSLTNLNLKDFSKKKITKIGVIFNLDEHHQSGSHWVALIIDLGQKSVYYYDSNGNEPNKNILHFINEILHKMKLFYNKKINYKINTKVHQKTNTECGMFSMMFLINYLKYNNFNKVINLNPNDKEMTNLRRVLFIPKK